MFFKFLLLSSSEIEYNLKHSFFFFSHFSELIVEDNKIVFESIDSSKMNIHSIPGNLFELFCQHFIFKYFNSAFLSDFQTFSK